MKLVIGLGNPGKQYAKTRHNVGFIILNQLRQQLSEENSVSNWELSKKFNAEIAIYTLPSEKIILAKPMTFMNDSGQAVSLIMHFYQIDPKDLIIVHDDKDLALGLIKVQTDRGHAGHNGIRSIAEHISTQNFTRVRVGIASDNPKKMTDTAKFVLSNFSLMERKKVKKVIELGIQEIVKLLEIYHNQ